LPPEFASGVVTLGTSVQGRKIVARRQGNPNDKKVMLVIGQMHGNERKGVDVVKRLRTAAAIDPAGDTQLWTIRSMNPDGFKHNRRYNARGVDLNRNYPTGWRRSTLAAGKKPSSEPEVRAIMSFASKLRPDAMLMFHQNWMLTIELPSSRLITATKVRRYARAVTGMLATLPDTNPPTFLPSPTPTATPSVTGISRR